MLMQVYMVLRAKQVERVRIAARSAAIRPGGKALTLGLSSSTGDCRGKIVTHNLEDNDIQLIRLAIVSTRIRLQSS